MYKIHEISTKVIKLDIKTILDNYLDKKFWKHNWTIYRAKDYEIKASLNCINIKDNNITLKISPEMINAEYRVPTKLMLKF